MASRDQGEAVEAEEPATEDETSRIKDLIAALACPLMGVSDPAGGSTVGGNEPPIIGALAPTATASAATACAAAVPAEAPSGATGAMAGGQRGDPSTPESATDGPSSCVLKAGPGSGDGSGWRCIAAKTSASVGTCISTVV